MTPETHLDMLITRSYLDSLHEECDSPQFKTYQTLMAHKAVVVAAREKEEAESKRLPYPVADLMTRAVNHPHGWESGTPRWSAVGFIFSLGSTSGTMICKAFGADPHTIKPYEPEDDSDLS